MVIVCRQFMKVIAGQELGPPEIEPGHIVTLVLVEAVGQRAEGGTVQDC